MDEDVEGQNVAQRGSLAMQERESSMQAGAAASSALSLRHCWLFFFVVFFFSPFFFKTEELRVKSLSNNLRSSHVQNRQ